MSQLLVRIAKKISSSSIGRTRHGLCFREFRSQSTVATPYLLFEPTDKEVTTASGEEVVDLNVYDPRKDELVKFHDQTLTKELFTSQRLRSSRGWVVAENKHDSTLRLTNMYNPSASVSSRKVISLPPTKYRTADISLSSSPDQDDCVVAAFTVCSSLIVCRPGDSEWTPVKLPFYAAGIIYSERDGKFYLNKRHKKGKYSGPFDLVDTSSSGFPQMSLYQPALMDPDFPVYDIPESRLEQLYSSLMVQHIVESPSGEIFMVCWFTEDLFLVMDEYEAAYANKAVPQSSIMIKPRGFVVFRQDPDQKTNSYTEDIGDLCIFLGANEAFCVSATECPGLNPNSIYFAHPFAGFGNYDLSSNTVRGVINPLPHTCTYNWLAPLQ